MRSLNITNLTIHQNLPNLYTTLSKGNPNSPKFHPKQSKVHPKFVETPPEKKIKMLFWI